MVSVEELAQGLTAVGFTRAPLTPSVAGWVYRSPRVLLAVAETTLERCCESPHQDESNAPWPVFLKLEARWLHAADIFRKNALPANPTTYAHYLSCLAKLGLFPDAVHHFYEYEPPEFLDVALSINTQTMPDELTPEMVRARVQPLVEGLVRVELYIVFGAALDALREELHQRAEMEKIRLPAQH